MFAGIHGAQRSGKSYFCVRTSIDFLRNTERDIYTNLPINPDYIAQFVCGRKMRNLEKYLDLFRRIHIFMDFPTLTSAKDFAKKNRDYWRFCRFDCAYKKRFFKEYYSNNPDNRAGGNYPSRENWPSEYYEAGYIWPTSWIGEFWKYARHKRTVFMFDEFYEHFSSMDYRSTEMERRKELLSFTRQHGHDNHHVYLISHKEADLDAVIRNGFMYQYYVSNAKYTNMFKNKWLRGFKHPLQFFRIEGYSSGDREPQDTYPIWPDPAIFKCYDSNSTASTLKEINFGQNQGDRYDDNHGHNFLHNFKKYFLQQGWITFVVISSIFLGGYYSYKGYKSIMPGRVVVPTKKKLESKLPEQIKKQESIFSELKVIGIFPNKVIWSDNFKLQTGDMYHGLKVKKINARSETVIFALPNGKLHSVPFSGCRIADKKQSDPKAERKSKR